MTQPRIEPRTYSLASDSYTSESAGHWVALLQSTKVSCSMLEYITVAGRCGRTAQSTTRCRISIARCR